jgi:hypothetical protein
VEFLGSCDQLVVRVLACTDGQQPLTVRTPDPDLAMARDLTRLLQQPDGVHQERRVLQRPKVECDTKISELMRPVDDLAACGPLIRVECDRCVGDLERAVTGSYLAVMGLAAVD